MDQQQFDRIAKALGASVSRRKGVFAAIGSLIGLSAAAETDAARKATRRHEKLACRNANSQCTTDAECCSGRCVEKFGGIGFRCAKAHGNKKKNGGNKDGGAVIPTGERCTSADTCADSAASCTTYTSGDPSGTYCLLPAGSSCSEDNWCTLGFCQSGTCAENCTVCAQGCPYTTIQGAYDDLPEMSQIGIAPGTYVESFRVVRNINFKRCGAGGEVHWQAGASDSYCANVDGNYAVTFRNLVFEPEDLKDTAYYALILVGGNSDTELFCVVNIDGCTFRNEVSDSYSALGMDELANVTVNNCTFETNYSSDEGGAIWSDGRDDAPALRNVLTITNSTFVSNVAGSYPDPDTYGGAVYIKQTDSTITNCTFRLNRSTGGGAIAMGQSSSLVVTDSTITGNDAEGQWGMGGGILLVPDGWGNANTSCDLTLAGSTEISGNTALNGSGIAVYSGDASHLWSVTGAQGRVSGNSTGPDCQKTVDSGTTWTTVTNCAF